MSSPRTLSPSAHSLSPLPLPSPLSPHAAGVPHLRHLGVGDLAFTGGPAVAVAPLAECTKLVAHSCSGTALLPRCGGRRKVGGGEGGGAYTGAECTKLLAPPG